MRDHRQDNETHAAKLGIDLTSLRQKENEKIYEEERYVRQQSLNIKTTLKIQF